MNRSNAIGIAALTGIVALLSYSQYRNATNPGEFLPRSSISLSNEGVVAKVPATFKRGEAIAFADWDADGDMDLLSSDGDSGVYLFRKTGASYVKEDEILFELPTGFQRGCSLDVHDVDGDGDLDVYAGDGYGNITFYRNLTR